MSAEAATPNPAAGSFVVHWSGMTHTGRVRPNNEDVFVALTFDRREVRLLGKTGEASLADADFIFAVSDGMGGAKSGEFASRITIDRITRTLPESFRRSSTRTLTAEQVSTILAGLVAAVHTDLMRLGASYEECSGMGATLTLGWVTPGRLHFAHVGDSRLYHLPSAGGIVQLTHDHTHVGWLRRQGKLNEREARSHPLRNALHQSLGAGNQHVDPQFGFVDISPHDRFVLCTDGLTDGLWDRHIDELVRDPPPERRSQPAAQRLVETAVANSGRDNSTAVVFDVSAPDRPPSP